MTPTLHFHSALQAGARFDDWPIAADGVAQSMVTLGPDIMEAIVGQMRAAFGRMVGRRRGGDAETSR